MTEKSKMKSYHGTLLKYSEKILKDGYIIKTHKKDDDHWLGHGIYFYEDYDLANQWAKAKASKFGNNEKPIVLKSEMSFYDKNYLNLDDRKQMQSFLDFCNELQENLHKDGYKYSVKSTTGSNVTLKDKNRVKCLFLDYYKKEHDILLTTYTFPIPYYPRYCVDHSYEWIDVGFAIKEFQICATNTSIISSTELV